MRFNIVVLLTLCWSISANAGMSVVFPEAPEVTAIRALENEISSLFNPAQREKYCINQHLNEVNDTKHFDNLVEIPNFTPMYFFRNANLDGSKVVAVGTNEKKGAGAFYVDMNTGKIEKISTSVASDAVPLMGHHLSDKTECMTVPDLWNRGIGLSVDCFDKSFYSKKEKFKEFHNSSTATTEKGLEGVYQSFGKMKSDNDQTTYKVLTDTGFNSSTGNSGLTTMKLSLKQDSNGDAKIRFFEKRIICIRDPKKGEVPLQLPMISPDGKRLSALEYNPETGKAVTKIFNIEDGKCEEEKSLGYYTGKASFSYDGKKLAFAIPKSQLADHNQNTFLANSTAINKNDIFEMDIKSGDAIRLTNNQKGTSYFPTYNIDGTLNFYHRDTVSNKTYIGRIDPKKINIHPKVNLGTKQCDEIIDIEKQRKLFKVMSDVLTVACNKEAISPYDYPEYDSRLSIGYLAGYDDKFSKVFANLSNDKCSKLITHLWDKKITPLLKRYPKSEYGYTLPKGKKLSRKYHTLMLKSEHYRKSDFLEFCHYLN